MFIFIDEESNSQWCGTEDSPCIDCKESYTASITSYCSDRIMCPFLSEKLIELYQKQMDCLNENSEFLNATALTYENEYSRGTYIYIGDSISKDNFLHCQLTLKSLV